MVVVGARVSGATVASLLGDLGIRTLLIDMGTFPSSTLSTHFFRGSGLISVLARLGLLEEVRELGSPPLLREYNYLAGRPYFVVTPAQEPGEFGFNLSVRRAPLDNLLVRRARRSQTVEVSERTKVVGLLRKDGRVAGVRCESPRGPREVRCRFLVGADGRNSYVARAVGATTQEASPPSRALYYRYVTDFRGPEGQLDGPEFSARGDEMAYVFPSDAGRTCVALTINLSEYRSFKDRPSSRFPVVLQRHPGIWDRFVAANPDGGVLGCGPTPNFVRIPFGPGWTLVGDAGLHQDPWSGRGMDCAGVHATFLAEALAGILNKQRPEEEAFREYHRRRDEHALENYRETVRLAKDLSQLNPSTPR